MGKVGKSRRPGRPKGQQPVIAVRLPEPLYEEVLAKVKDDKTTITETVAALVTDGLRFRETFGDIKKLMAVGKAQAKADFEAEMRRQGFRRERPTGKWIKLPGVPTDPFELGAMLEREATTERETVVENELNKIDAALDDIEQRIASLRSKRKERA